MDAYGTILCNNDYRNSDKEKMKTKKSQGLSITTIMMENKTKYFGVAAVVAGIAIGYTAKSTLDDVFKYDCVMNKSVVSMNGNRTDLGNTADATQTTINYIVSGYCNENVFEGMR